MTPVATKDGCLRALNNLFVRVARSFAAPPSRHPVRFLLRAILMVPLACAVLWCLAALWIDAAGGEVLRGLYVALFVVVICALIGWARPFFRFYLMVMLSIAFIWGWWLTLAASNDRDWFADVARLPGATLEGSLLTVTNLRGYSELGNPDSGLVWRTETYDLDELVGTDILLSFWGPSAYGHTMTSWEFADGRHLAISIETRKERHEVFSALRGFFRQFELYYVIADEADLVALRTAYRGEQVELYRMYTPDDGARALLLDYVTDINALRAQPRWYHAVIANCTTSIWRHARAVGSSFPLDWRLLANGYVVELGYELGTVNNTLGYPELRAVSNITEPARQAVAAGLSSRQFSRTIRRALPPRPTGLQ